MILNIKLTKVEIVKHCQEHFGFNLLSKLIANRSKKCNKLESWSRAQSEAARRHKSDWGDSLGGRNSARSNVTCPKLSYISLHSTRSVYLGWVNMRAYHFFC